jgi:hypothetical protein
MWFQFCPSLVLAGLTLWELIPAEAEDPLQALGVRPALSAAQLANVMLALSNGLAIEQLLQPQDLDPDLFERTLELITVGLQHIGEQR